MNVSHHLLCYCKQKLCYCLIYLVQSTTYHLKSYYRRIVTKLGGVLRDSDYQPYVAKLGQCRWNGEPKPVPVVGFRRIPPYAAAIKDYIYRYGPVSAGTLEFKKKDIVYLLKMLTYFFTYGIRFTALSYFAILLKRNIEILYI